MPPAGPIRPALDHELARLGKLYQRASFSPHLAGVARFARDTLGGEVFVAERGGELAGGAACAHFGASGWVGAVGVPPEHRRAGLGRALTMAAVERLLQLGVSTVLLYATAMGRPLYERLGFVPEGECMTLVAAPWGRRPLPPGVRVADDDDLQAALAVDRAATGEDRARLLSAFWPQAALVAESDGRLRGYFLSSPWRPGGGIVAEDLDSGLALIAWARRYSGGELSLSLPAGNAPALRALSGWTEQAGSRSTRMRLGPSVQWQPEALFSTFNLFWG